MNTKVYIYIIMQVVMHRSAHAGQSQLACLVQHAYYYRLLPNNAPKFAHYAF